MLAADTTLTCQFGVFQQTERELAPCEYSLHKLGWLKSTRALMVIEIAMDENVE